MSTLFFTVWLNTFKSLKTFALKSFRFYSEEHFPDGVQQIFLYQKMALKVFIISPGRFYHSTRKLNMVELDMGFKYIYTLGWVKYVDKADTGLDIKQSN